MEKTKVNSDLCFSSGKRDLAPEAPFHRSQQARERTPPVPREQGSRLQQQRERAGRSRESPVSVEENELGVFQESKGVVRDIFML